MGKDRAELNVKFIVEEGSKLVAIESEGINVIGMINEVDREKFLVMSAEIAFAGMMTAMKGLMGDE